MGDIMYTSVHGSISLPSDEPQGGTYKITNCGVHCHVLMRLDDTHFDGLID